MATLVNMVNETTGETEKAYTGFSWTALFFGFFVPMFRSDWGSGFLWIAIYLGFALALTAADPGGTAGGVGIGIIMGFIYNKRHYARLVAKGFVPATGA